MRKTVGFAQNLWRRSELARCYAPAVVERGQGMANGIRLVVCVVVVLGLVLECALGLFMPRHIQVRYASLQARHGVVVELPSSSQAADWLNRSCAYESPQELDCRAFPER